MTKAFIFDLNGTMIDDMEYHAQGWYHTLNNELNAGLSREEVNAQMYGKNEELLIRIFGQDHFTPEEMQRLSMEKERRYQEAYRPKLALLAGLQQFLEEAAALAIPMAIASAAIPFNIDFVLDNLGIRHFFTAIVSAADVQFSKPHPETFLKAAALLGIAAQDCLVFEDAPKGVEAGLNAGMKTVVLTTMHTKESFAGYQNAIMFVPDYTSLSVTNLID